MGRIGSKTVILFGRRQQAVCSTFSRSVYILFILLMISSNAWSRVSVVDQGIDSLSNGENPLANLEERSGMTLISSRLRNHTERSDALRMRSIDALMAIRRLQSLNFESIAVHSKLNQKGKKSAEHEALLSQINADLAFLAIAKDSGILSPEDAKHFDALSSQFSGIANQDASNVGGEETLGENKSLGLESEFDSKLALNSDASFLDLVRAQADGSNDIVALAELDEKLAQPEALASAAKASEYVEAYADAQSPKALAKNQNAEKSKSSQTGLSSAAAQNAALRSEFSQALNQALRSPIVAPTLASHDSNVPQAPKVLNKPSTTAEPKKVQNTEGTPAAEKPKTPDAPKMENHNAPVSETARGKAQSDKKASEGAWARSTAESNLADRRTDAEESSYGARRPANVDSGLILSDEDPSRVLDSLTKTETPNTVLSPFDMEDEQKKVNENVARFKAGADGLSGSLEALIDGGSNDDVYDRNIKLMGLEPVPAPLDADYKPLLLGPDVDWNKSKPAIAMNIDTPLLLDPAIEHPSLAESAMKGFGSKLVNSGEVAASMAPLKQVEVPKPIEAPKSAMKLNSPVSIVSTLDPAKTQPVMDALGAEVPGTIRNTTLIFADAPAMLPTAPVAQPRVTAAKPATPCDEIFARASKVLARASH